MAGSSPAMTVVKSRVSTSDPLHLRRATRRSTDGSANEEREPDVMLE